MLGQAVSKFGSRGTYIGIIKLELLLHGHGQSKTTTFHENIP